mgnify:CR=1 FL=1
MTVLVSSIMITGGIAITEMVYVIHIITKGIVFMYMMKVMIIQQQ